MTKILVIIDPANTRRWQVLAVERVRESGHAVAIRQATQPRQRSDTGALLAFEALRFRATLSSPAASLAATVAPDAPELTVDFSETDPQALHLLFNGDPSWTTAAAALANGRQVEIAAVYNGSVIAEAQPMVRDRLWVSRGLDDVLARAVTLIEMCVRDFAGGRLQPAGRPIPSPQRYGSAAYWPRLAAGVASRAMQKLTQRGFYWRVGYRLDASPSVAETSSLAGAPWTLLPDDGQRFYADPFVFVHEGRTFLFVEDYPYALARGLVSVAELRPNGRFGTPRIILDQPWHLSYPQVFARDGEIWMLPETSAEKQLMLYRADSFPDRWVRHAVLIDGVELSDATLVDHAGRLWLFGSVRDGAGSPSDVLHVYGADRLTGPWRPHRRNPILIDRARARPGGAVIQANGRLLLPVQDGTEMYGGGLGLCEILELTDDDVRLGPPTPITGSETWSARGLHTYNRAGAVEVVDGFAVKRR